MNTLNLNDLNQQIMEQVFVKGTTIKHMKSA